MGLYTVLMGRWIDSHYRNGNRDRPKPNQAHRQVPQQAAPMLERFPAADEHAAHFTLKNSRGTAAGSREQRFQSCSTSEALTPSGIFLNRVTNGRSSPFGWK